MKGVGDPSATVRVRRAGWIDLILAVTVILLLPGVASSSDLGDNYYADSSYHNWMEGVGLPTPQSIYEYYVDNRMGGPGGWLSTDLSGGETTTHHSGSAYVAVGLIFASIAVEPATPDDHVHVHLFEPNLFRRSERSSRAPIWWSLVTS